MFFRLSSLELGLLIFGIVLGTTLLGAFVGSRLRAHAETLREPFGVIQAALLGLVALILAFGLTMAVGRYDQRRAAVVDDANAIGTTYLRAQTLREPLRTRVARPARALHGCQHRALELGAGQRSLCAAIAEGERLQRFSGASAGEALAGSPTDSAPRLYVETLNEMIDMQTVRVSALNNRVPSAVLQIRVIGAAVGLGLLALYLAILSRGVVTVVLAAAFVSILLLITFDLDRPTRGLRDCARHATRRAARVDGAPAGGRGAVGPLADPRTRASGRSRPDPEVLGEGDGIRTHDHRDHNPGLYQLSYALRAEIECSGCYGAPGRL